MTKRCDHSAYGFDIEGHSLLKCTGDAKQCPKKQGKCHISQMCYYVKEPETSKIKVQGTQVY